MKIHHALSVLVCSLFTTFFYAADETKQSPEFRRVAVLLSHLRLSSVPSYNSMTDLAGVASPTTPAEAAVVLSIFPMSDHGTGSPITPKRSAELNPHGTGSPVKKVCSYGSVDRLA